MGIFFRTFAAVCAADAIDRAARNRPTRYWYPNQPGLPRPGTTIPYVTRRPSWGTRARLNPAAARLGPPTPRTAELATR